MQQLEIPYFFPLTEQILLNLDFSPCVAHEEQKRKEMIANSVLITTGDCITEYAFVTGSIQPSFTIDVDQTSITIVSKKKPNFAKRWIYKTLGVKWKGK